MTPRTRAFVSLVCSTQSHLSLSLLMDPVRELHHLRVDAGAVQPGAALTPAHDPCQEPPPATLQTHQRAPGVALGEKTSRINLSGFTEICFLPERTEIPTGLGSETPALT